MDDWPACQEMPACGICFFPVRALRKSKWSFPACRKGLPGSGSHRGGGLTAKRSQRKLSVYSKNVRPAKIWYAISGSFTARLRRRRTLPSS